MGFPKQFKEQIMKQGEEDYANTPYEDLTSTIECMRLELQTMRADLFSAGLADINNLRTQVRALTQENRGLSEKAFLNKQKKANIEHQVVQSAYDAFNTIKRRDVRDRVIKAFIDASKKRAKK